MRQTNMLMCIKGRINDKDSIAVMYGLKPQKKKAVMYGIAKMKNKMTMDLVMNSFLQNPCGCSCSCFINGTSSISSEDNRP